MTRNMGLRPLWTGLLWCFCVFWVQAQEMTQEALPDAARAADYLLLGEVHDNAPGHALRLHWLQQLGQGGKRVLAMEQLDADHQSALDQAVKVWHTAAAGDRSVHAVAEAGGFDFRGWKWDLYEPVLRWALDQGWPIVATNRSRQNLSAVLQNPEAAPPPEPQPWSDLQRQNLLQEVREGHCNLLPEAEVARMAGAQRLRDATMARALVQGHQAGGLPVVLLAGNGHLRQDLAVPVWLRQLDSRARIYTLAVLERSQERVPEAKSFYDQVVWVTAQTRPDPCVALRQRLGSNPPPAP